jgi:hypothetical protein
MCKNIKFYGTIYLFTLLIFSCTKKDDIVEEIDFTTYRIFGDTSVLTIPESLANSTNNEAKYLWFSVNDLINRIKKYKDTTFKLPTSFETTDYVIGPVYNNDSIIDQSATYKYNNPVNQHEQNILQFSTKGEWSYFEKFTNCIWWFCPGGENWNPQINGYQYKDKSVGYLIIDHIGYATIYKWKKTANSVSIRITDTYNCSNTEYTFNYVDKSGSRKSYSCYWDRCFRETNWNNDGGGNWFQYDSDGTILNSGNWN